MYLMYVLKRMSFKNLLELLLEKVQYRKVITKGHYSLIHAKKKGNMTHSYILTLVSLIN